MPAISLASAAPAFAGSTPTTPTIDPGPVSQPNLIVQRCTLVPAQTYSFTALNDGDPAAGAEIDIVLPAGLAFTPGGTGVTSPTTARLTADLTGTVQLPSFTATGPAGTYTIMAAHQTARGYLTLSLETAPGAVVHLQRQAGGHSATPGFTPTATAITAGAAGSVNGDSSNSSGLSTGSHTAVVNAGGTVAYWGPYSGGTPTAHGTLAYSGSPLIGMEFVSSWTSLTFPRTGGVAAGATTGSVYQWYADNGATPVVTKVDITGNQQIEGVLAEDGLSYALTSSAIWYWTNTTDGSAPVVAQIPGAPNPSLLTTWSHSRDANNNNTGGRTPQLEYGGAALTTASGGRIAAWRTTDQWSPLSDVAPSAPVLVPLPTGVTAGGVKKLIASDAGIFLLSDDGALYSLPQNWSSSTTATAWQVRQATGVVDFDAWGFDEVWAGGLWLDSSGQVTEFFREGGSWTSRQPRLVVRADNPSQPLSDAVKVFASDGSYMVLTGDGEVYVWGGNLDHPGRGNAALVTLPPEYTVADLNVWGLHIGPFYGGGYIVLGSETC